MVIWINNWWIPLGSAGATRTEADLLPEHQNTAQQRGMLADRHQPWPGGATGPPAHPKQHLTQTWYCSGKESLSTKSDLDRKGKQPWNYVEKSQKAHWPTKIRSNMLQYETDADVSDQRSKDKRSSADHWYIWSHFQLYFGMNYIDHKKGSAGIQLPSCDRKSWSQFPCVSKSY